MIPQKRWKAREEDGILQRELSQALQVSPIVARILLNRGITTPQEARQFMESGSSMLHDPFLLPDLPKAVERIESALGGNEKILIYGDYDVDGVTATSLYVEFFKMLGKSADYYIPSRLDEGYGLNKKAVQRIGEMGVGLMITADCGTTSHAEIALAQELGIDVIVTDHHQVPRELPPAYAMINPHRSDANYPFTGLCAVGIALKVVQGLLIRKEGIGEGLHHRLLPLLDLVALGTIADVAPLRDENRYLVKEGLQLLSEGRRLGIRMLKEVCGLGGKDVGVGTVGFVLAPRINAGGRMARANEGVILLTTSSQEEARRAAHFLDQQNQERQRIEAEILKEVHEKVASEVDLEQAKALVLASSKWHPGVIGIIASRVVERYYRPTIIIALTSDGIGKGSARSIPAFHLYEGLTRCSDLMEAFGGHQYAAGLTIREEKIGLLRERLGSIVSESLSPEDFQPGLMVDAEVQLDDLDLRLMRELDRLSPYGVANPEPVLVARALEPLFPKVVGNGHLKLRVRRGAISCDAIGFRMGDLFSQLLSKETRIDLAFTLTQDTWQGQERLQLRIRDLRAHEGPEEGRANRGVVTYDGGSGCEAVC